MNTTFSFVEGEHLILEPCDGSREWMVFRDYAVRVNGMRITVPEGFITDLASVPALARAVIDDNDPDILKPAVIHDFLYRTQGRVVGEDATGTYNLTLSRRECDLVLLLAMEMRNARKVRRWAVYAGVRLFGGIAWRKGGPVLGAWFLALGMLLCACQGPGRVGVAVGPPAHPGYDPHNLGMDSMDYLYWLFSLPVGPPLSEGRAGRDAGGGR